MIKKIPIAEIKVGMYLHDVNCSWRVHPNFPLRFRVGDDSQIEEIRAMGVREVYIDTAQGDDLPGAPTDAEVREAIEDEVRQMAQLGETPVHHRLASREEIQAAVGIHDSASQLIRSMMNDIRLGRQIEFDTVAEAMRGITGTMLGNFGSMIQLGQLKNKDDYTFQHSVGVGALMTGFAKLLELNRKMVADIGIGALLHDIGKTRVPLGVLNKPGRLTDTEFAEIKQHVSHGRDILKDADWISPISFQVMEHHHERFDGSGYPAGLAGSRISVVGQMAAIVDVYDALTSIRIYHQAMLPVEALRKLQEWSRFHFNPELVTHFIRSLGIYPVRTVVRLESGLIGIVVDQNSDDLTRPVVCIVKDGVAPVAPHQLDLAKSLADRIVAYELPETHGIDVDAVLAATTGAA